jgi:hypothetical protein
MLQPRGNLQREDHMETTKTIANIKTGTSIRGPGAVVIRAHHCYLRTRPTLTGKKSDSSRQRQAIEKKGSIQMSWRSQRCRESYQATVAAAPACPEYGASDLMRVP